MAIHPSALAGSGMDSQVSTPAGTCVPIGLPLPPIYYCIPDLICQAPQRLLDAYLGKERQESLGGSNDNQNRQ